MQEVINSEIVRYVATTIVIILGLFGLYVRLRYPFFEDIWKDASKPKKKTKTSHKSGK